MLGLKGSALILALFSCILAFALPVLAIDLPPCPFDDVAFDFELHGTENDPGASGFALYSVLDCERRLVVELEGITSTDAVLVIIDGEFMEGFPVHEGTARLELDTGEGQDVPFVFDGSVFDVFAIGTEELILSSEGGGEGPPPCESDSFVIDFHLGGTEHEPEASGVAIYSVEVCERRLVIEIEGVTSTNGVLFIVDGEFIGDFEVVEGTARLQLDTRDEQEVPHVTEGSVFDVFAAGTEILILTSEMPVVAPIVVDVHLIGTEADPEASGIAVYRVEGPVRTLVVEMEHIATANAVDVFVDGVFAGFTAVTEGFARLERDTSEGHTVPEVSEESLIEVLRNDSDVVILTSHLVFVDFVDGSPYGSGGETDPVNTLGTALAIVQEGGFIKLSPGTTSETGTITQQVTLLRDGITGTVVIGGSSRSSSPASETGFVSRSK